MVTICCDFCGKPVPVDMSERVGALFKTARTKEMKTSDMFPHLCEDCATKLDMVIQRCKKGVTEKQILTEKMAKLNEERRAKLNSKG